MFKYFIFSITFSLVIINIALVQGGDVKSIAGISFASVDSNKEWGELIVLKPESVWKIDLIEKVQGKYIKKLYPDYRLILKIPIKDDKNRFVETFSLVNSAGEKVLVHFDMTQVYKNLKSKDKETKIKIEELERNYMEFNRN